MDIASLFDNNQLLIDSAFSPLQIILSLLVTLLEVLFIFYIYKKTYSGVLYSKNFNLTLIITALVVNAIMIGISGNIVLSLGLVGALSIIRFRTAVKDPKDTAFLFWAITIGVINGVAYYELSVIASIFIAAVLIVLSRQDMNLHSYVLIVKYAPNSFENIEAILKKYFKTHVTRSMTTGDQLTEKVIEIDMKNQNSDQILNQIKSLPNVSSCTLISSDGDFVE